MKENFEASKAGLANPPNHNDGAVSQSEEDELAKDKVKVPKPVKAKGAVPKKKVPDDRKTKREIAAAVAVAAEKDARRLQTAENAKARAVKRSTDEQQARALARLNKEKNDLAAAQALFREEQAESKAANIEKQKTEKANKVDLNRLRAMEDRLKSVAKGGDSVPVELSLNRQHEIQVKLVTSSTRQLEQAASSTGKKQQAKSG